MNEETLLQEQNKLTEVLEKVQDAKKILQKSMKQMGAENLEKLKQLRDDPQTEPHDLLLFMETMHQKNTAFNFKDKYQRLEEFENMEKEPYFARIDLKNPDSDNVNTWYIGKFGYTEEKPVIVDWRAKIASVYYRYRYPQKNVSYETPDGTVNTNLDLKRTFEIDKGELTKYYNNDIQLDENTIIVDKISHRTGGVLEDIVETIQADQMEIIESDPRQICIVQGCVGSGKSTVAIHKLSHIFFNYPEVITPQRSILVAKNQILVGYLSTLFPKLGIFDINYKSFREMVYNLVFREELKFDFDLNINNDISQWNIKRIENVRKEILKIHDEFESSLSQVFEDPEFETFGGFIYNNKLTVYENIAEVIAEMEEELEMQKHYLKEYGGSSVRSFRYKENIKVLKRIISKLKRLRIKLRENSFNKLVKSLGLPINGKMGYSDVLVYVFAYSEVIGLKNSTKYEYCVLDEGQDFALLELLILSKLVINGRFCILGDLNQAILDESLTEWNEVSKVIEEAGTANVFELDTNYRSTKQIIDFANEILSPHTDKFLPKSINRMGEEPVEALFESEEEMLGKFGTDLQNDVKEIDKSIGIIVYDENLYEKTLKIVSETKLDKDRLIVLDSMKRITYLPKGVYLAKFDDCKGLEFAKVYVLGLNRHKLKTYNEAKRGFVAVTRAMNELEVLGINK